ncbi:GDSL-type esterase/lipase family protein [Pseudofrankia asymbiotica]|uniref:GDSL family lipase n=1 Tax=Pseudofrankia asymbiotica TaxID=1834516 RepID=A0A1V2I1H4_9ACTN|nr:GDSL-type esterase/lipase family protein [Pseudofrankia asymbiotica]ONH22977.1 GDSL family lipase [Pseudofrankia asymbiotica]
MRRTAGRCRAARHLRLATLLSLVTIVLLAACSGDGAARGGASATSSPPQLRVMIVGDSITHESAGDYTWRYRLAEHLTRTAPGRVDFVGDRDDIWDNVADKGGSHDYADPAFDSEHHSRWGISLRSEVPQIEAAVRAHPADVMLIALGANDLTYWTQPPDTAVLMKQLIDNARRVNPNMTFVVGHVLTRADFRDNSMNLPTAPPFNAILDAQAPGWSTPTSRVVVARTDIGWDPLRDAWDGSHPTPDGEVIIARGFADALAGLGIGTPYGPLPGHIPWPGIGRRPTVVLTRPGDSRVTVSWAATPGATEYFVERKAVSWGEPDFIRAPAPVTGYSWTSDPLLPGVTVAYRIVPMKGRMPAAPGPATTFTVGALQ